MAGAPLGNQNATRGRIWRQAIERALEKRSKAATIEALDELAEKLLVAAESGEGWALKELGDRLEGKPAQAIIGGNEDDPPIQVAEIVIRAVDAARD